MESYHGMLACVIAGAGLALIPRSMLESMPGHQQVSAWPLAEEWPLAHHLAGVAPGRQNPPAGGVYSAAERRSANSGFLHKRAERIGLIRRQTRSGSGSRCACRGDGRMLMDTGLQAQGMAVALTRFRFQRRQQLFSQLLAAVLGIGYRPASSRQSLPH